MYRMTRACRVPPVCATIAITCFLESCQFVPVVQRILQTARRALRADATAVLFALAYGTLSANSLTPRVQQRVKVPLQGLKQMQQQILVQLQNVCALVCPQGCLCTQPAFVGN